MYQLPLKTSVQDGRQDDQGDAPDEDSKRPDLACVLGAAQAECGDDELNQAHGEDDDSQSDGGGVCRGLGIAKSSGWSIPIVAADIRAR